MGSRIRKIMLQQEKKACLPALKISIWNLKLSLDLYTDYNGTHAKYAINIANI